MVVWVVVYQFEDGDKYIDGVYFDPEEAESQREFLSIEYHKAWVSKYKVK